MLNPNPLPLFRKGSNQSTGHLSKFSKMVEITKFPNWLKNLLFGAKNAFLHKIMIAINK